MCKLSGFASMFTLLAALAAPGTMMAARNGLEGTWLIDIKFDGNPPPGFPPSFPVMHTYIPSGELVATSSIPTARGAEVGEWIVAGPRQFRMVLRFFVKDNLGAVIGYAQVRQWVEVNPAKTKFTGCRFIGEIFSFQGQRLLNSAGSCTGNRIEVDTKEPSAVPTSANLTLLDQE